jgi:hypothetical protein
MLANVRPASASCLAQSFGGDSMCNGWNHPLGCPCNFRGGHGGANLGSYVVAGTRPSAASAVTYYHSPMRMLAASLEHSVTFPTECRYCGTDIYLYASPTGGFAIFDALGKPWPKHDCPGYDGRSRADLAARISAGKASGRGILSNFPELVLFSGDSIEGTIVSSSKNSRGQHQIVIFTGSHCAALMVPHTTACDSLDPMPLWRQALIASQTGASLDDRHCKMCIGAFVSGEIRFIKNGFYLTKAQRQDMPDVRS